MEKVSKVDWRQTSVYNKLVQSYLLKEKGFDSLVGRFPTAENIKLQAQEKLQTYSLEKREVLVEVLEEQHKCLALSDLQKQNLLSLKKQQSVTITTGHQLNLLTGPLYFLYKILQTIKLCDQLNDKRKDTDEVAYVPIYWMASEDHDFEEINHFHLNSHETFSWDKKVSGAVGETEIEGLADLLVQFFEKKQKSKNRDKLIEWIKNSYGKAKDLSEATRFLVHELFSDYGVLIIDANDKRLKQFFSPFAQEEILNQTAFDKVSKTNENLTHIQVNPREVNLFYLDKNLRERIVVEQDRVKVLNTDLEFSKEEFLIHIEQNPEKISPNAILRPLYQEVVLPNVVYIGGGGELAYWFQLKSYFESQKVVFPILLPRNTLLLLSKKQDQKLEKLNISKEELFLPILELQNKKIKETTDLNIDWEEYENRLASIFKDLQGVSTRTHVSFSTMLDAQKTKQTKGLDKMKKRFVKAERKNNLELTQRIEKIHQQIFPKGSLQERKYNFSSFYLSDGQILLDEIYDSISALEFGIIIKTLS